MILLKNGFVIEDEKLVKKDIYIENGYISEPGYADEVYDCQDCFIMPGACDIHVHLREPGFSHKETILSGTMAAAKGGITTLFAMANINPVPDSLDNLKIELDKIKKDAVVNVYPVAALTKGLKGIELSDIDELAPYVYCFSDDGVGINDMTLLEKACEIVKKHNKVILSHAEDKVLKYAPASEYLSVKREIEVAKKTGVRYHFCHLSTEESFEFLRQAQLEGYNNITAEVAPHHLFLNENDIKNANWKMNPPLRSEKNRIATQEALLKNICCVVASDHAPHTKEEKSYEYDKCPNGILGLETMLPIVYTKMVKTGMMNLVDFEKIFVHNPRRIVGLPKVGLEIGQIADIAVMDLNKTRVYKEEEILSLSKNTPFIGENLSGFMRYTFVSGKLVYKEN